MVGKWEQIERAAREDELTELERELRGRQERGGRHRRRSRRADPGKNHRRQPQQPGNESPDTQ